jgi:2-oxo-4-hydroxy-4-carboxy-5-ureidoimidazoline decarboxylase
MTDLAQGLDLDAVNTLDREAFVAALGSTFEHAPWVARDAWAARPFGSVDGLHAAMLDVVRRAPRELQVVFLRQHPELAGREAQAGTMTRDSVAEQASAGLDALSRDEMDDLRRLNARYRARHDFPFIVAVRRHRKAEIFELLRRRTERDTDGELREALVQVGIITRLRIGALLEGTRRPETAA